MYTFNYVLLYVLSYMLMCIKTSKLKEIQPQAKFKKFDIF